MRAKLVYTAISAALGLAGVVAIITEEHTGSSKLTGIWTMRGADAIWFGQTCLILACLPLIVWAPARFVGYAASAWWVGLMLWFFVPSLAR